MKKFKSHIALLTLALGLNACSTSIEHYQDGNPELKLHSFLNGKLSALGMIQDYSGKVTRRFCVDIDGSWQKAESGAWLGQIDEAFYFDDGKTDMRLWQVEEVAQGKSTLYQGTAGDVIGTATGTSQGFAFRWQYELEVPIENDKGEETIYLFKVDDWIYLMDENRAINRSSLKKFGVEVGQITIVFDKLRPSCDGLYQ